MPVEPTISVIAHVIQISVAPVFLLSGIAGMLGVLASRLSRIVDRARVVETLLPEERTLAGPIHDELSLLSRRARMVSLAIGLCTATALLVSAVIAVMFLSAIFSFDTAAAVALLFIAAMLAFIAALIYFLREILLATTNLRFGPR
jgi:hypothetical protein